MNDVVAAYIKGRQEGFFNVRLEYSILEKNQQSRAFFAQGYQIGKSNRQQESINESEGQKNDYDLNRKAYITIMGYRAASKGETVNSLLLKGDDKVAFEEGYKVGLLHKNGNMNQISLKDLETYLMITGYEITDESYLVYLDMLKDNDGLMFNRGHKVNVICKNIHDDAINELKNRHLDLINQDAKKVI